MSAAIEMAAGPMAVAAGGAIVPVIVAAGVAGTDARVRASPLVGPPVMTGSPIGFCQVLAATVYSITSLPLVSKAGIACPMAAE